MATARIFKSGNSQAVRLPKEFRLDGDEVVIKRVPGGGVLLMPKKISYERILEVVSGIRGKIERKQPEDQERNWP
jgi:antitoxin VapB